jgi:hypothetical protein
LSAQRDRGVVRSEHDALRRGATIDTIPGMPMTVQVTVDCSDPHRLAAWWAELLGWQVEPQDAAFIQRMIDGGYAAAEDAIVVDGRLVWRTGCAINAPDGTPAPRILFQWVPEEKTTKNRVHLDLRAGSDTEPARARAVEMGAVAIGGGQQGPHSWVTFTDPEGNEFCL